MDVSVNSEARLSVCAEPIFSLTFSLFKKTGTEEEVPELNPGNVLFCQWRRGKLDKMSLKSAPSFFLDWSYLSLLAWELAEATEVAALNCVCFWLPFNGQQAGERRGFSGFGNKRDGGSRRGSPYLSLATLPHLENNFRVEQTGSVVGRRTGMCADLTNFVMLPAKLPGNFRCLVFFYSLQAPTRTFLQNSNTSKMRC